MSGTLATVAAATMAAWLFTLGPIGTRSDEHYGTEAAAEYEAWLKEHRNAAAVVSSCSPLRTGLDLYGRPGYYSCAVRSTTRCVLIYQGVTDFGAMSRAECTRLAND